MAPERLFEILAVAERLKCTPRHSWTSTGRRESVAEHCWRLTLMALLVADEFPGLCIDRVVRMCLIHDLGEAFTGDIPAFEKQAADEAREAELLSGWVSSLPEPLRSEWQSLFAEMEALETPEAKLCKALDKLEAVIQHNEADLATWLPVEYELQMTYGDENCAPFPFLAALRQAVREQTCRKTGRDAAPANPD